MTWLVVFAVTFYAVPEREQPVPVTANVTAPVPDPPAVVNVTGVPAGPDTTVFDTVSVACATAVNVNTFTGLVTEP